MKQEQTVNGLKISVSKTDCVPAKLAVLLPGFLDSKDYEHFLSLHKILPKYDYTVASLDAPGIWTNENYAEYSLSNYLKSIEQVINYFCAQQEWSQIVLIGHSMGGKTAILYAGSDVRISAVISLMSPYASSSRTRWGSNGIRISNRDFPGDKTKYKTFELGLSYVEDSEKYNALKSVSAMDCALLLIAGEKDTLVLPQIVEQIYKTAHEPKKFMILPGVGHNYRFEPEHVKLVNKEIIKFLLNLK